MKSALSRRQLVAAAPTIGLAALMPSAAAGSAAAPAPPPEQLYRTDDEAKILATLKEILAEDWVGTFITVDEFGVPRARSVGISDPDPDLTIWISTRRGSRKIDQVRAHRQATLHFARDALKENFKGAYYASIMGEASVHIDDAEMRAHVPEDAVLKENWPNYPNDYAVIQFKPKWLEVYGHGIKGKPETWQPQAVVLPA